MLKTYLIMKRTPLKPKMTIFLINSIAGEVEVLNYSKKRLKTINNFISQNLELCEQITYQYKYQSKKHLSQACYIQLYYIVTMFETNVFNDFTEEELKFKEYIYKNFIIQYKSLI